MSQGLRIATDATGFPREITWNGERLLAKRIALEWSVEEPTGAARVELELAHLGAMEATPARAAFAIVPPGETAPREVRAIEWADGSRWEAPQPAPDARAAEDAP